MFSENFVCLTNNIFKDSKDQPNWHKSSSETTEDQEGMTDALVDFFTDLKYTI